MKKKLPNIFLDDSGEVIMPIGNKSGKGTTLLLILFYVVAFEKWRSVLITVE